MTVIPPLTVWNTEEALELIKEASAELQTSVEAMLIDMLRAAVAEVNRLKDGAEGTILHLKEVIDERDQLATEVTWLRQCQKTDRAAWNSIAEERDRWVTELHLARAVVEACREDRDIYKGCWDSLAAYDAHVRKDKP